MLCKRSELKTLNCCEAAPSSKPNQPPIPLSLNANQTDIHPNNGPLLKRKWSIVELKMDHCWVENGPFLGWEALASCANPSAMLNKFDWNLKSVWLKVSLSLTETQVKFDWNLNQVWLKLDVSLTESEVEFQSNWRAIRLGLEGCCT